MFFPIFGPPKIIFTKRKAWSGFHGMAAVKSLLGLPFRPPLVEDCSQPGIRGLLSYSFQESCGGIRSTHLVN
jgi:hypothetical protein